jgi:hypothetical protein
MAAASPAGDSILAEFPSVVDALQCALGIQERIGGVNDEVPEERRVSFRIGIHVGEAMVRSGDLFGDAVNVAARMQGLAQPGAVCLSGSAYEYVHTVLAVTFEDLGTQLVKNLDSPIRAYLTRLHPLSGISAGSSPHRGASGAFHAMPRSTDGSHGPGTWCPPSLPSSHRFMMRVSTRANWPSGSASIWRRHGGVKRLERRGFVQRATRRGCPRVLSPTPAGIEVPAAGPATQPPGRVMAPLSDGKGRCSSISGAGHQSQRRQSWRQR